MSAKILVVEDEPAIQALISVNLKRAGHEVLAALDAESAQRQIGEALPDLILLDWMLPRMSGLDLARRLRTDARTRDVPIIMLTARGEEADKVQGLTAGADDYVTKPFSPRELVARVHVMLRRPRHPSVAEVARGQPPIAIGPLSVDVDGREVRLEGRMVELTRIEFDLLATMAARPRVAFSRRQLIDTVWGDGWVGDEHLVDVHIGHLRRKLGDDASSPRFVRTVRGVGYRMGEGQ